jgi:hypothetical protein
MRMWEDELWMDHQVPRRTDLRVGGYKLNLLSGKRPLLAPPPAPL